MNSLQDHGCHFTWEWLIDHLSTKPQRYIRNLMESLNREDDGTGRDLSRFFALKGYLTYRYAEVEGDNDLQNEGIRFLERALEECQEHNHGYKYIILNCLFHIENDPVQRDEIFSQIERIDLEDEMLNREIHAMKAYAAGKVQLRQICIDNYEKAGTSVAEWCFGLALVLEHNAHEGNGDGYRRCIELLNTAIRLDDNYVEAKIKKAKILGGSSNTNEVDEARDILESVLRNRRNSLKIKEAVADAYRQFDKERAIELLRECLEDNENREKTLRRLGLTYRLIERVEIGQENLNTKIQVNYKISLFYKEFPEGKKEVEYLQRVIDESNVAKQEENFRDLKFVNKARKRLDQLNYNQRR